MAVLVNNGLEIHAPIRQPQHLDPALTERQLLAHAGRKRELPKVVRERDGRDTCNALFENFKGGCHLVPVRLMSMNVHAEHQQAFNQIRERDGRILVGVNPHHVGYRLRDSPFQ
ncbi:hypothetical protein D3C71_1748040 [compost metagenome]